MSAMNWNRVDLNQVSPTPWRNGGGLTRELVAWPQADDWSWRLSVAEVASDGPFSQFDSVQRWFAVLAGNGVRLDFAGHSHRLTSDSAPLCFDGAAPVFCSLLDGATQDLNLMVRKDQAKATMLRVNGARQVTLDAPAALAIYLARGPATLELDGEEVELQEQTLVWQRLNAGASLRLAAPEALWMEIRP